MDEKLILDGDESSPSRVSRKCWHIGLDMPIILNPLSKMIFEKKNEKGEEWQFWVVTEGNHPTLFKRNNC